MKPTTCMGAFTHDFGTMQQYEPAHAGLAQPGLLHFALVNMKGTCLPNCVMIQQLAIIHAPGFVLFLEFPGMQYQPVISTIKQIPSKHSTNMSLMLLYNANVPIKSPMTI